MGNTISVATNADGTESKTEVKMSAGGVHSSNDYQAEGIKIISEGSSKVVQSTGDLQDDDIVFVDGMEVQAKMARELGLLARVFPDEEGLSVGNAAAGRNDTEAAEGNAYQRAVDAGQMTADEAQVYDTTMAQMELAGMDADTAVAMVDAIEAGGHEALDVDSDKAALLTHAQTQVTEAATQAALGEIGQDGFSYLQRAAEMSPEVNAAIRGYAIQRATGEANGLTWRDLMADVKAHLG
jgi:hypothetical protein